MIPVGEDGTRYAENVRKTKLKTRRVVKARRGDTVSGIAKRYRVSPTLLAEYNNLSGNRLRAGQTIKIPGKASLKASKKKVSKSKLAKGKSSKGQSQVAKSNVSKSKRIAKR